MRALLTSGFVLRPGLLDWSLPVICPLARVWIGNRPRRVAKFRTVQISHECLLDAPVDRVLRPSTQLAYTASMTATPCPARRATSVAGTPAFNHNEIAACRRSYGLRASSELDCSGVSTLSRTRRHTSAYVLSWMAPPVPVRNSRPSAAAPQRSMCP
jgi:hypothetical protein